MEDATGRAAAILRANRYVALGTADAEGPWAAPAQYRLLTGGCLYVESHVTSRHARAIGRSGAAAGAVYDSRAAPADADGVQFASLATVVPRDADRVAAVLARRLTAGVETAADLLARPGMHLLHVEITALWVFDCDAWRERGRDDRLEVDPAAVFALLAS